ncbi:MAG TPA: sialidase family protein [Thermoanaerobaculia bacterium]|nr:sialidase family protein [Thermoanaerobaculia bacterium]
MRRPLLAALLLAVALAVGVQARDSQAPALERQLAADRVPPGSALAALIQDNQDFARLRPEELGEDGEVPPWLRVLWRKSHPEGTFSAADPTGGYPLALKEIHEWMTTHPDLRPGPRERDALPVPSAKAAAAGSNVRVSGASPVPRSESDVRVDFRNPRRIIAASNNLGGSGAQAQYWSMDGGATWGRTTLPLAPGDAFQTDPTVDWTSDGTAWATTIGVGPRGLNTRIRAYRSTDGGATWTLDGTVSGDQRSADKQQVWVDHGDASPYRDTLYAIWHDAGPVYVNRRRPGGGWEKPVLVSGKQTGTGIGGDVKTNAAGIVFALWPNTVSHKVQMVRSTNGGATWSAPAVVAATLDSFDIGIPAQSRRRALVYLSAGAFRRGASDLVYAAWTDLNASDCLIGRASTPATACRTRVWLARSTDGGRTWEPARKVDDPPTVDDQFNQALAVDEATGALGLVYYSTAGDPGRHRVQLWYQASQDDGVTWSQPLQVTTAASNEAAPGAEYGNQFGDYNGLTGWAGTFFPSWTDRRNGGREEIWTAPLEVPFEP